MPTSESREGPTPNGGVRSEIFYHDGKFNAVDKSEATHAEIVELDESGNAIFRIHGLLKKPAKPRATKDHDE